MGAEHAVIFIQAVDLRRTMAANATEAVTLAPPQVAAAATVREMTWTADGGYLVVLRRTPAPEAPREEIVVWGLRSGKTRTLATFDPAVTTVGDLQPMGGTDRFLVTTMDRLVQNGSTITVGRNDLFSASSGSVTNLSTERVASGPDDFLVAAIVSPSRPIGLVERVDAKEKRIRGFGPDGRFGPEFVVGRTEGYQFDAEGFPMQIRRNVDPKTGKSLLQSRRIDLTKATSGEWRAWAYAPPMTKPEAYEVGTSKVSGANGLRGTGILLGLPRGGSEESAIVSTDGKEPMLSPKGDAIAYLDQGLAMVRTLTKVDRQAYDEALRRQRIAEAVNRAKQLALGVLQYAADHKDTYPGQGSDIRALTMPYVKDTSQYEGFSYTFGGAKMDDIDEIASTEMGYVSGPGGRAVIYTDGHVKWRPDGS